jgi:hypothetical protein
MRASVGMKAGCVAAALAGMPLPAAAVEIVESSVLITRGRCSDDVHAGRMPRYHRCANAVAYMDFTDGTKALVFSNGTSMFYFVGKGANWNQKGAGTISLTKVATGYGDKFEEFPATGTCRFGNLHSGQKVSISCAAKMEKGHWSAAVLSDGKPPFKR